MSNKWIDRWIAHALAMAGGLYVTIDWPPEKYLIALACVVLATVTWRVAK